MTHEVELVYELSPMQQAMLYHSLYAPASGVYVVQSSLRLRGRLDVAALARAWRHVVGRHDVLRTAFYWQELEKPMQVVYRRVDAELVRDSWAGLDDGEQQARLERFLDADRERGFDLAEPPLMRLALFELGPDLHQLICSEHHLLGDGWSQAMLRRELFTCYRAFAEGCQPLLEPVRPYREYIAWLQRQDLERAEAFWRRRLAGFSAPSYMAAEDGRPTGAADYRHARRRGLRLPLATTLALRDMGRRHRLTLNTLAQGAWALLLARSTGAEDVVFGATVAGRPTDLPSAQSIVGLFINTLPVRAMAAPDRRLAPWLAELQERQMELRDYEHTPLHQVQQWSELAGGAALFDHVLVFENYPPSRGLTSLVPDLAITAGLANELSNYPLTVLVVPGDELSLEVLYDLERFATTAAIRLLERFAGLLAAFAADPDVLLADLPVPLSGAERQQVLREWNDTAADLDGERCLHQPFERQAALAPAAAAILRDERDEGGEGGEDGEEDGLTYAELDARAAALAASLRGFGVGPESRVGVALERGVDLVIALLAVLKAGGCYVPLDLTHPAARLGALLADCRPALILLREKSRGRLPAAVAAPIAFVAPGGSLQGVAPAGAVASVDTTAGTVLPDHLAYVIYTSGSTGAPKGVGVSHRAILNRLLWMQRELPLTPADRVVWKTPFSFDASIWELFVPLFAGACVVLARPDGHRDSAYLADLAARRRITVLQLVPSMLGPVLDEPRLGAATALRRLYCGGEALPADLVARAAGLLAAEVHNLYGPTEAAIDGTHWACRLGAAGRVMPIGRPISNMRAHVLDPGLRPLPIGMPGELHLAGTNLARGYWERPDLTAERFIPDPHASLPGSRLYRTGDLARSLADGRLEFLGRLDHQIKVRGFRIELGEIEAALAAHPGVRQAVVVACEDAGDRRLAAYVVGRAEPAPAGEELRSFLQRRLPDFMIPASFTALAAFPTTASGKLDRRALPAPAGAEVMIHVAAAPRTAAEELLAGIWAAVLELPAVGVDVDFFALGGHSLLAMRIAARVRQGFQVDLPVALFMTATTVAAQAAEIAAALAVRSGVAAPALADLDRTAGPRWPLSSAQQRLWFMHRLDPQSAAFNMASAVRLAGPLDTAALEGSFAEIWRRHDVLGATFGEVDGEAVQEVVPGAVPALPLVDLAALAEAPREAALAGITRREVARPFDLRRGPVQRITLLRLAAARHAVLLVTHHAVCDGWSTGILARELSALYGAFQAGRPSPLPELPLRFADFALWQRRQLAGDGLARHLDYWTQQLAGAPPAALPADRRPAGGASLRSPRSPRLASDFPPELGAGLRAVAQREGATLFMALLAAFAALLHARSGQEDFVVGTTIASRHRVELEPLVGCFVNQLALRVRIADGSFSDLVAQVREATLGAYTHQDLPFERLVQALRSERDRVERPLFGIELNFLDLPPSAIAAPGLAASELAVSAAAAQLDLAVDVVARGDRLSGSLQYDAELFRPQTAADLWEDFAAVLALASGREELTVEEIRDALSAAEAARRAVRERAAEEEDLLKLDRVRRRAVARRP